MPARTGARPKCARRSRGSSIAWEATWTPTPGTMMGGPSSARAVLMACPAASSMESGTSNTQFAILASIITLCSPDFCQAENAPAS
eukprot:8760462-Pyramimonas_sp.AAC.1